MKWASQGVGGEENHNDNAAVLLQALDDANGNDEPDQRVPDGVLGDSGIAPPPGDVAASAAVAEAGRLRLELDDEVGLPCRGNSTLLVTSIRRESGCRMTREIAVIVQFDNPRRTSMT